MGSKGAIVLAAGYSSRMNAFKPLLDVDGKTAAERVIDALKGGGVDHIAVVTGHNRQPLLAAIRDLGVHEAYNPEYGKGMFSSIQAGVKKLNEISGDGMEGFLLMPVDYAAVSAELITQLISEKNRRDKLAVPCYRGKKGHPLWIPAVYIEEILSHGGAQGIKYITRKYEDDIIHMEMGSESVVMDMDTEEDYAALLEYWRRGRTEEDIRHLAKGRRVIFVRHGQIAQHEKKIFLGQSDIPLSDLGRHQAERAGAELRGLGPQVSAIYSSDLIRARETAEIISKALAIKDVAALKELREMSLGPWDGQYIDDIKEKYPSEYEDRGKKLLSYKCGLDAENFYDLQYRAVNGLKKILKSDGMRDIIIATHSGVIATVSAALRGQCLNEGMPRVRIEPGEIRMIEV